MTAVAAFARLHDAHELPANEPFYRDLIPLSQPGPGEQYAFEVDLDACTGCKSCVVACHSLNGLDDDESWRCVGLLQGGGRIAFQQTVTTACHHCVEPACLTGCPVNAYEKDEATGIVSHLDDQCIGCGYCTLTCPYEVPRFNETRGIVRKCDMCRGRLEVGEAPACVQSCPNGAIRISIVDQRSVVAATSAPGATLVPGAPASALTAPTTTYRTTRTIPDDVRAADHFSLRSAHPHPPLAAMLVLTQLAVGALALSVIGRSFGIPAASARPAHALVVATVSVVAMAASTLHLGRPRQALRAVLGVSHSWLSREVVAFGSFSAGAVAHAVAVWRAPDATATSAAGWLTLVVGAAGVACSVQLYAVTGRAWWRARRSSVTFMLSGLSTGGAATLATTAWWAAPGMATRRLAVAVVVLTAVKVLREATDLLHARRAASDLERSALLLRRDLWSAVQLRVLLAGIGGVVIPLAIAAAVAPDAIVLAASATVATVVLVAGEVVERHLFFRVAVAPRMPGDLH